MGVQGFSKAIVSLYLKLGDDACHLVQMRLECCCGSFTQVCCLPLPFAHALFVHRSAIRLRAAIQWCNMHFNEPNVSTSISCSNSELLDRVYWEGSKQVAQWNIGHCSNDSYCSMLAGSTVGTFMV